jgi:hypothetical protein
MSWNEEALEALRGATVVARGQEIGSVEEVFPHAGSDQPAIARVATAGGSVLLPLTHDEASDGRIESDFDPEQIKGAPAAQGDVLTEDEFEALYRHYGISDASVRSQSQP